MLTPLYRSCVRHGVAQYRGGDRLMRTIRALVPELLSYPVVVEGRAPIYINLAAPSWQEHELFLTPTIHEPHLHAVFHALIDPSDTVVDVGANLGRHLVVLDALAGYVHAFEPNPALTPNLRRTVEGLRHTLLHPCAVGDVEGYIRLDVPADHSMAHIAPGGDIPITRLDTWFGGGGVKLIKVDVEGAEAGVFRGGVRTLNRPDAPILIFEELRHSPEARSVLASYTQAQYRFWVIPHEGAIVPYTEDRPEWCDVLAVPARRHEEVARRLGPRVKP